MFVTQAKTESATPSFSIVILSPPEDAGRQVALAQHKHVTPRKAGKKRAGRRRRKLAAKG